MTELIPQIFSYLFFVTDLFIHIKGALCQFYSLNSVQLWQSTPLPLKTNCLMSSFILQGAFQSLTKKRWLHIFFYQKAWVANWGVEYKRHGHREPKSWPHIRAILRSTSFSDIMQSPIGLSEKKLFVPAVYFPYSKILAAIKKHFN